MSEDARGPQMTHVDMAELASIDPATLGHLNGVDYTDQILEICELLDPEGEDGFFIYYLADLLQNANDALDDLWTHDMSP